MAVTIDATVGGANANSYDTLANALLYFNDRLNASAFTGASSDDQARALILAAKHIDLLPWDLDTIGWPASTTQKRLFPTTSALKRHGNAFYLSTEIPDFVIEGFFEQALYELQADRTADPGSRGLSRVKAGVVEVEFDGASSGVQRLVADHVLNLFAPWLSSTGLGSGNRLESVCLERA